MRKVPNVCPVKSKLNWGNLKNDKPSELKKFYGWTEHQLEQNVRMKTNDMGGQVEQTKAYQEIYAKKE